MTNGFLNEYEVPVTDAPIDESTVDTSPKAIRAWAKNKGVEIGDRGRIKAEIRNSYLEEHGILDTTQD